MSRPRTKNLLMATLVAAILFAPASAMAAVDVFLKITDITGESPVQPGQMDVLSWSWGTSTGARTQRAISPACIQDLNLMKMIDTASPQLIMNGITGKVADEAVLTMRNAGERPAEFLVLTMTNVTVNSYQISGSSERPMESITLHFETMRGEYRRVKADGTADDPVVFNVGGGGGACK